LLGKRNGFPTSGKEENTSGGKGSRITRIGNTLRDRRRFQNIVFQSHDFIH
jgi:hypothetical protein